MSTQQLNASASLLSPFPQYEHFLQLMERLLATPYSAIQEEFVLHYRRHLASQSKKQAVPLLEQDQAGVAFSTAQGITPQYHDQHHRESSQQWLIRCVTVQLGRRKTSQSSVVLRDGGSGQIIVNGQDYLAYFPILQDR